MDDDPRQHSPHASRCYRRPRGPSRLLRGILGGGLGWELDALVRLDAGLMRFRHPPQHVLLARYGLRSAGFVVRCHVWPLGVKRMASSLLHAACSIIHVAVAKGDMASRG